MSRISLSPIGPLQRSLLIHQDRMTDSADHLARPCHCPRPPREHDGDADPPYNEHAGY